MVILASIALAAGVVRLGCRLGGMAVDYKAVRRGDRRPVVYSRPTTAFLNEEEAEKLMQDPNNQGILQDSADRLELIRKGMRSERLPECEHGDFHEICPFCKKE